MVDKYGILTDDAPDYLCEAIVLNHQTCKKTRFRTKDYADKWCGQENLKLYHARKKLQFASYLKEELTSKPNFTKEDQELVLIERRFLLPWQQKEVQSTFLHKLIQWYYKH